MTTADEATRTATKERLRYGNFRKPGWPGLFTTSPAESAVVGLSTFMLVPLMFFKLYWLMAALAAFILFVEIPLVLPSRHGSRAHRLARRRAFSKARRRGETALVQGPTGRTPDGRTRLPGMAAQTVLHEWETNLGDPVGVIEWPKSKLWTVVIRCMPPGRAGRDQKTVDHLVASWGGFLASLGLERVAGASVIVETVPGAGRRQRASALRGVVDNVPEFAQVALEQSLADDDEWEPMTRVWVTITFDARRSLGAKPRTAEQMRTYLSGRLPFVLGDIRTTGAGETARFCDAQELVDTVHGMVNPSAEAAIDEARQTRRGTGLDWRDAGPMLALEHYDRWEHDGAVSRSWVMLSPARGEQTDEALDPLLAPHSEVQRKRVAVLFRPEEAVKSAQAAEAQVKSASFGASKKERVTSRQRDELAAALKTEDEESAGALLQRFSMVVTATAFSDEELEFSANAIEGLLDRRRLGHRIAYGSQTVAAMASTPIGMVVARETKLPDVVRDAL